MPPNGAINENTMSVAKIKVLIVDDHELVRSGIKRLLADVKDIDVVGEAESGEDAIKIARDKQPHVILMDVKMPGIGGLEATRKIGKKINQNLSVVNIGNSYEIS